MGLSALSPWHLAIFAIVVLVVFGPKRLPEMGRSLGKGMREFKDSISGTPGNSATEESSTATMMVDAGTGSAPPAAADRDTL